MTHGTKIVISQVYSASSVVQLFVEIFVDRKKSAGDYTTHQHFEADDMSLNVVTIAEHDILECFHVYNLAVSYSDSKRCHPANTC